RPVANTMAVSVAGLQRLSPDPSRPESLQRSVWREPIDHTLGCFFHSDRVLGGGHEVRARHGPSQLPFFFWAGNALAKNVWPGAGPRHSRRKTGDKMGIFLSRCEPRRGVDEPAD